MTSVSALASRIRERKWALLSLPCCWLRSWPRAGLPTRASEVPDLPGGNSRAGRGALVQSLPSRSRILKRCTCCAWRPADTGCRVRLMAGDTLLAESTLVPGGAEPAWADVPVSRAVPPGGAALRIQIEGVGGSDAVFFISPYPSAAEPLMLDGAAQDGRLVYALTGTVDSAEKPVLWLIILALGLAALLMLGEDIRRNFCVLAAALGMIALIAAHRRALQPAFRARLAACGGRTGPAAHAGRRGDTGPAGRDASYHSGQLPHCAGPVRVQSQSFGRNGAKPRVRCGKHAVHRVSSQRCGRGAGQARRAAALAHLLPGTPDESGRVYRARLRRAARRSAFPVGYFRGRAARAGGDAGRLLFDRPRRNRAYPSLYSPVAAIRI